MASSYVKTFFVFSSAGLFFFSITASSFRGFLSSFLVCSFSVEATVAEWTNESPIDT
jgi:hypothetical protein